MLIDIHVHSEHDDNAELKLADVVQRCKQVGLDGFCLTNVHGLAGLEEAKRLAAEVDLVALVGFEALTELGHFLVFVPEPDKLPAISEWLGLGEDGRVEFASLARAVAERKGILVAAHPYAREVSGVSGDQVAQLPGLAALEVFNGRHGGMADELAEELAVGLGLVGVGGSDARHKVEEIGSVATLFAGKINNEAELIEAFIGQDVWPVRIGGPAPKPYKRSTGRGERRPGGRGEGRRDGRRDARRGEGRGGRSGDGRNRSSNRSSNRSPRDGGKGGSSRSDS
ncbi:MAG: phosphoesterase [Deltaproteobacteria bacterium]|nr:phosphoesterase [Deltaproteobacteria bacterium]